MRVTFGEFALDFDRHQLTRAGEEVRLSPKAYSFLQCLVQRRPAAVSRKELYDELWPDVFVSESNLATIVSEVRHALDDDARRPRFLRTVFGFGYAFIGDEGTPAEATPSWRMAGDGIDLVLSPGETIIGRAMPELASYGAVSREHARVTIAGDTATIEDLGSKNGTFVGGRRIHGPTQLVDGDTVIVGKVRVTFRRIANPGTTLTER